jgi:hypothetical protein
MFYAMEQRHLFPIPYETLSDEQVAEVLWRAIAQGGRLSRGAELHLSTLCAEHLVAELRAADLEVVRRRQPALKD